MNHTPRKGLKTGPENGVLYCVLLCHRSLVLLGSCVNCCKKCDIHANMRKMQISYIMGHQQQTPLLTFISLTLACNSHTGRKKQTRIAQYHVKLFCIRQRSWLLGRNLELSMQPRWKLFKCDENCTNKSISKLPQGIGLTIALWEKFLKKLYLF